MDRPGASMGYAFPKPGPGLKVVLAVIGVVGILEAILQNWTPFGDVLAWLVVTTPTVLHLQLWRLVTAGVLTSPESFQHLLFTLVGLYFLSPDLEKRWGTARFVRFVVGSTVIGFALGVLFDAIAPASMAILHPRVMFGAGAAIAATAIAWARANENARVLLFFFLPVSGRALFWATIGFCVIGVIYGGSTEGVVAPFGGVLAGVLMSGEPSPLRRAYLQLKLAFLRRRGVPTARDIALGKGDKPRRPRGGPPLRVVQGGLEDDLEKRQPPKDKRYLN